MRTLARSWGGRALCCRNFPDALPKSLPPLFLLFGHSVCSRTTVTEAPACAKCGRGVSQTAGELKTAVEADGRRRCVYSRFAACVCFRFCLVPRSIECLLPEQASTRKISRTWACESPPPVWAAADEQAAIVTPELRAGSAGR